MHHDYRRALCDSPSEIRFARRVPAAIVEPAIRVDGFTSFRWGRCVGGKAFVFKLRTSPAQGGPKHLWRSIRPVRLPNGVVPAPQNGSNTGKRLTPDRSASRLCDNPSEIRFARRVPAAVVVPTIMIDSFTSLRWRSTLARWRICAPTLAILIGSNRELCVWIAS